jgi:hypothetical protein
MNGQTIEIFTDAFNLGGYIGEKFEKIKKKFASSEMFDLSKYLFKFYLSKNDHLNDIVNAYYRKTSWKPHLIVITYDETFIDYCKYLKSCESLSLTIIDLDDGIFNIDEIRQSIRKNTCAVWADSVSPFGTITNLIDIKKMLYKRKIPLCVDSTILFTNMPIQPSSCSISSAIIDLRKIGFPGNLSLVIIKKIFYNGYDLQYPGHSINEFELMCIYYCLRKLTKNRSTDYSEINTYLITKYGNKIVNLVDGNISGSVNNLIGIREPEGEFADSNKFPVVKNITCIKKEFVEF